VTIVSRKNKKFSGRSIAKYSAKMEDIMKERGMDDASARHAAEMAAYHYAIGQGGYHVIRKKVGMILDKEKISGSLRLPFYAMAQRVYKMVISGKMDVDEIIAEKEQILDRYFSKGTEVYEIASKIFDIIVGKDSWSDE
jgi:hypothetical protein